MKYTPDQKRAYFSDLRKQWAANKTKAAQDQDARAKWEAIQAEAPAFQVSYYGFTFALYAMRAQGLDGFPYIDAKTFHGWRDSGFKVKKGQHSMIHGLTWIKAQSKDEYTEDDSSAPVYPKSYALFHRTQVEAI